MISWLKLTSFGGIVVTAPAAAAITAWLMMGRAWRLAGWWCVLFIGGMALVVATKIAFIGWGLGIQALDFTGISGHAMRATAVYPVLFYLVMLRSTPLMRMLGATVGLGISIAIDVSRVVIHAHSISEAVAGFVLGGLISIVFLRSAASLKAFRVSRWALVAGLLAVIASSYLKPVPTERWIEEVALAVSGHDQPFTRIGWKPRSANFQSY
ncbi:phosphatase PAP2 family protein [Sulfuriferula sp. GW1]|uniref:phosphatase PAP2 family protein n=1 Tax=Sulfuriferula sp. GW1 TaxID=3345111 RepID=UPI0039B11713